MATWLIVTLCVIAYVLIAWGVYAFKIKNWENHSKFERIYFSAIWFLLLPLYIIHKIHNM